MSSGTSSSRGPGSAGETAEIWTPKTRLGLLVSEGKVTSMQEIIENGWTIKEAGIVRMLLPDLRSFVADVGIVQKQTDAGEVTRFGAVVAVGNGNGFFGVGKGKARHMRTSIDKATVDAFLKVIPVRLGCGSWECRCGRGHSVPFRIVGQGGSVRVDLIPGPRGLGLVAGETVKSLLSLAGVKDVWTRTYGSTSTSASVANAIYDAMSKMHKMGVPPR